MASRIKGHQVWAVLVLVAAALWVGTGKFASVGSEEAHASQAQPDAPAAAPDAAAAEPAPPGLRVVAAITPVFADHAREIRVSGITGADKRAVLAARASGVISALPISKGDRVAAGDVVMTVEGADVTAAVDQAKATLASAELDLGYTTIYSPVNGTVVSRNVEEGQTVVASFQTPTLFVLAQDLTRMQVIANVSESDIGGVTEGKSADFRVDAYPRESFHGIVTQVRNAPVSIQNVVTYDVIISVENPELKLKPGMTANITIVTARNEEALRAPNAALRFRMPGVPTDRKTPQLWILDATGRVRAAPVTLGIADSLFTDITSGDVHEGEAAIVGLATAEETAQEKLPPGFEFGPKMR